MRPVRKLPTRTYGRPRPPTSPGADEADKSSATLVDFDMSPIGNKRGKEIITEDLQPSTSSQETRIGAEDQRDDNDDDGLNQIDNLFSRKDDLFRDKLKSKGIAASSDAEEESEEPFQFPWQLKLKEMDLASQVEDSPTTDTQELASADLSIAISPPTTPLSSRGSPPLPTKTSRAKPLLDLDSGSEPSVGSSKRVDPKLPESGDAASMSELDAKGKRKRTTRSGKQKQKQKASKVCLTHYVSRLLPDAYVSQGLTKKEQEEAKRAQARILREQRVSIARPEDRGNAAMRLVSALGPLLLKSVIASLVPQGFIDCM